MDKSLAQKLLSHIEGTINHNVNIIDETGIIVASFDKSREGTFHETAYRMIERGISLVEVHEDDIYQGTKKGVNMLIDNKGAAIGVVGITGEPEEVRPLALLLKTAVEVIVEHEAQQIKIFERKNMKDHFFNQLLYTDGLISNSDFIKQAENLGYSNEYVRIPLLISVGQRNLEKMVSKCKTSEKHTKQDMLVVTTKQDIVVFIHIPLGVNAAGNYRQIVKDYIESIERNGKHISCEYSVGSLQAEFVSYHSSYLHALWLKDRNRAKDDILFFYDYVREYLDEKIPENEKKKYLIHMSAVCRRDFGKTIPE